MKILALAVVAVTMGACTQLPNSNAQVTRSDNTLDIAPDEEGFVKKNQGIILDSGTTALGLSMGFAEANPLLTGACGTNPLAVGLCSIGAKKLVEKGIVSAFGEQYSTKASKYTNSASYLAGCSNIALIAGAAFPANIAVGAICAKLYWDAESKKEPKTNPWFGQDFAKTTN